MRWTCVTAGRRQEVVSVSVGKSVACSVPLHTHTHTHTHTSHTSQRREQARCTMTRRSDLRLRWVTWVAREEGAVQRQQEAHTCEPETNLASFIFVMRKATQTKNITTRTTSVPISPNHQPPCGERTAKIYMCTVAIQRHLLRPAQHIDIRVRHT